MLAQNYPQWFRAAEDILFSIEFVLVQLFLIYHLVRALFFAHKLPARRRRASGGARRLTQTKNTQRIFDDIE